ncbi:MAG: M20/M25/M40 family metallo-hydrolase [Bacteroidetes bacterium]|nr:M20/M25/M40 family metallo-hydrolase [Bacteroidota bacterium]
MKKSSAAFTLFFFIFSYTFAQSPEILKIRAFREQNENAIINEFVSLLSIPNIANDSLNIKKNAAFIMDAMNKRGIQNVQLLSPTTLSKPPVVYGEANIPQATHTIIFYAHYDGQPVNSLQWTKPLEPFKPQLLNGSLEKNASVIPFPTSGGYNNEWRIYGRGASDDKAGVMSILNAYDAIIKSGLKLHYNIKFFFEGEEEAGSSHLSEILEKYKSLLQSDVWIICDGPVHQSGKKQIVFGVRGDCHLDLTIYASKRPLHSGHYGNWAPNPAMMLAKLLASMKDEEGKITIKDFYADVIPFTDAEKKALAEVPSVDEQMKKELGIASTEMPGKSLVEAINLPSLNINGMSSGNVGKQASNVIPTTATAVLDLRLVLGNDWRKQQQKIITHIRDQGYYVVDHEPTDEERSAHAKIIKIIADDGGYNAQRTSMELPIAKNIIAAVQKTTGDKIILVPSLGGSLPLFLFEKYLNAKTIIVPIANHDNNQHAENENIRLQNLCNGIETMASIMLMQPE